MKVAPVSYLEHSIHEGSHHLAHHINYGKSEFQHGASISDGTFTSLNLKQLSSIGGRHLIKTLNSLFTNMQSNTCINQ